MDNPSPVPVEWESSCLNGVYTSFSRNVLDIPIPESSTVKLKGQLCATESPTCSPPFNETEMVPISVYLRALPTKLLTMRVQLPGCISTHQFGRYWMLSAIETFSMPSAGVSDCCEATGSNPGVALLEDGRCSGWCWKRCAETAVSTKSSVSCARSTLWVTPISSGSASIPALWRVASTLARLRLCDELKWLIFE